MSETSGSVTLSIMLPELCSYFHFLVISDHFSHLFLYLFLVHTKEQCCIYAEICPNHLFTVPWLQEEHEVLKVLHQKINTRLMTGWISKSKHTFPFTCADDRLTVLNETHTGSLGEILSHNCWVCKEASCSDISTPLQI